MKTLEPPEFLYHGTSSKAVESIMEKGILSLSRNDVHLSLDLETALNVGKRHGVPVIFKIKAKEMYNDNFEFRLSENNVWLTDYVPPKYIKLYKENN